MKFSIGDPVYIKSNDEEGVIIRFLGGDMAEVRVGAKHYNVYVDDMEHPYLRWFLGAKKKQGKTYVDQLLTERNHKRQQVLPHGVYLVFFPQYSSDGFDDVVSSLKVYMYNETGKEYDCSYQSLVKGVELFDLSFTLFSNREFYLHDISFEEAAQSPCFYCKITNTSNAAYEYEEKTVLKPKKLYDNLHKIRHQNQAFFSMLLAEEIVKKTALIVEKPMPSSLEFKKVTPSAINFTHSKNNNINVIDLHIEKLCEDWRRLSPREIFMIQCKEVQNAVELAVALHKEQLTLIHGVGKGRLKEEIHLFLNQTKEVRKYVNQYDNRYGYGATEVFFRI